MRKPTKQQVIDRLEERVRFLESDAARFGDKLTEARRRTVPMNTGDSDVNFLPIAITSFKLNHNVREFTMGNGFTQHFYGRSTCIIECSGEVVISPNTSTPATPAKPAIPPHGKGWEILREFEAKISNKDKMNDFTANARLFEGAFTSGHITESQYRAMLAGLLPR